MPPRTSRALAKKTAKVDDPAPPARAEAGHNPERTQLGAILRAERKKLGWTIERASEAMGVAPSTLSKTESGLMSPTFDLLQKIAKGMSIDLVKLFDTRATEGATGRRAIVPKGTGPKIVSGTYEHELLGTELSKKKFMPFRTRITARSLEEFGALVTHKGEEFLMVLAGEIELHTEYYAPARLGVGDSAYLDSLMGHALIAVGPEKVAEVIWVTSDHVEPHP